MIKMVYVAPPCFFLCQVLILPLVVWGAISAQRIWFVSWIRHTLKMFSAFRSEPVSRVRKRSDVWRNLDVLPTPALFLSMSLWQTVEKTLSNDQISLFLTLLFLFAFVVHFSHTFCCLLRCLTFWMTAQSSSSKEG